MMAQQEPAVNANAVIHKNKRRGTHSENKGQHKITPTVVDNVKLI
jgi:hypothetical protein